MASFFGAIIAATLGKPKPPKEPEPPLTPEQQAQKDADEAEILRMLVEESHRGD
jgi:hypothetical protein